MLALAVGLLLMAPSAWGQEDGPFVVLLVAAAGLDYDDSARLVRQLHKRSQFKQGFMGHAWVYLEGRVRGRREVIEAGLSPDGEGAVQYFRAVLSLARFGSTNPTETDRAEPRPHPNPIAYLWQDQGNGYLQPVPAARLRPTAAVRLDLDEAQHAAIRARLNPRLPEHRRFQLNGQQCTSFVVEIAALAGVSLNPEVTIPIPREVRVQGQVLRLWTDPVYSRLTLDSPDALERELQALVVSGRGRDVLRWYLGER